MTPPKPQSDQTQPPQADKPTIEDVVSGTPKGQEAVQKAQERSAERQAKVSNPDKKLEDRLCPVCGDPTPPEMYCRNECQFLDKTRWRKGVTEQDVVAGLLGSLRAGRYLPAVVKQIDFVYKQSSEAQRQAVIDEVHQVILDELVNAVMRGDIEPIKINALELSEIIVAAIKKLGEGKT